MVGRLTTRVEEERGYQNRQYDMKMNEIRELDSKLTDILDTETNVFIKLNLGAERLRAKAVENSGG